MTTSIHIYDNSSDTEVSTKNKRVTAVQQRYSGSYGGLCTTDLRQYARPACRGSALLHAHQRGWHQTELLGGW